MSEWFVYVMRCADNSLYTGITTSLGRRLAEHNAGGRVGARYTRGRRPVTLVYREAHPDRSAASKRESAIRKMKKADKEKLISTAVPSNLP